MWSTATDCISKSGESIGYMRLVALNLLATGNGIFTPPEAITETPYDEDQLTVGTNEFNKANSSFHANTIVWIGEGKLFLKTLTFIMLAITMPLMTNRGTIELYSSIIFYNFNLLFSDVKLF